VAEGLTQALERLDKPLLAVGASEWWRPANAVLADRGSVDASAWAEHHREIESVLASQDARAGARAFTEKRPPVWTGC
jgi:enoyl-CoA hydratase/carnithine racemase